MLNERIVNMRKQKDKNSVHSYQLLCSFDMFPLFSENFLIFWQNKIFPGLFCMPLSKLAITLSSPLVDFRLVSYLVSKIWKQDFKILTGCHRFLDLLADRAKKYMYMYVCVCVHTYTKSVILSVCKYFLKMCPY